MLFHSINPFHSCTAVLVDRLENRGFSSLRKHVDTKRWGQRWWGFGLVVWTVKRSFGYVFKALGRLTYRMNFRIWKRNRKFSGHIQYVLIRPSAVFCATKSDDVCLLTGRSCPLHSPPDEATHHPRSPARPPTAPPLTAATPRADECACWRWSGRLGPSPVRLPMENVEEKGTYLNSCNYISMIGPRNRI